MDYVKTITSEAEVRENIIHTLRERKETNQTAFYLDKGAELYYNLPKTGPRSHVKDLFKQYYPFLKKILQKNKKVAFISMGCGNSSYEKESLKMMKKEGYSFSYFGVDSSISALELAKIELEDLNIEKEFLCADFENHRFKEEINELTKDFDLRIYAFFSGTIGNIEPSYLADIMTDIMEKDDYLWADVSLRTGQTALDDRKLYERYRDYLSIKEQQEFRFYPLAKLGIPIEKGNLFVEMNLKEGLNALKFTIKFKINEKVKLTYRDQRITFLPGDEVALNKIIIFDPKGLINFFEERDFKLKLKDFNGNKGQFFFKYMG